MTADRERRKRPLTHQVPARVAEPVAELLPPLLRRLVLPGHQVPVLTEPPA